MDAQKEIAQASGLTEIRRISSPPDSRAFGLYSFDVSLTLPRPRAGDFFE